MGHDPTIAIRDFSGEVQIDRAAPESATLKMQIRANSLEVMDELKSKDRQEMESVMNQKVLDSSHYPNIVFEGAATSANQVSEGRFQVEMNGMLSLHGITGRIPMTVQVALLGDMLRSSGDFSLRQSSFGIPIVKVAGGALKVKDELKFTFDIVARKQE
jgi:polyisoprenoid-binding protein YceI